MAQLFTDDFARSNSSTIGGNWVENGGDWQIISGALNEPNSNNGSAYCWNTSTLGTNDYTVQADITQASLVSQSNVGMGIFARMTDTNNFVLAWIDSNGSTTTYRLYNVVGGGYNDLADWSTSPLSDPVQLRLEVQGTAVRIYVNGTLRINTTQSSNTSGRFGCRIFNGVAFTGNRWDNVTVNDFTGGTSYKDLTGNAAGVATVSVTLSDRRLIPSVIANGVATVSVTIGRRRSLTAASAGVATCAGTVTARRSLTGASAGAASVSGAVTARRSLVRAITAAASCSGTLTARRSLTGLSAGVATAAGMITRGGTGQLSGLSRGVASCAGAVTARRRLLGSAAGLASGSGLISKGGATGAPNGVDWSGLDFRLEGPLTDVHWNPTTKVFTVAGADARSYWQAGSKQFTLVP